MTATPKTHVVVVGGGYAGTLAANHLRQRPDVEITVVNPRPVFVERIRLHQVVAGTGAAIVDYDWLLGDGIRLVVDSAERIAAGRRRVHLGSGTELDYDYLIYAVGSFGAPAVCVPGAAEFAHSVADLESALRLRHALADLRPDAPARPVTLICGAQLGPSLSHRGRRSVAKRLLRLGVDVRDGAAAIEVLHNAVALSDGTAVSSAVTVWTAGFAVPDLAARSGLSTDAVGRLVTDETLTSADDDRVVAAGDAAAPSGQPLRMSCQAAGPLGVQAANTVLSRIAG